MSGPKTSHYTMTPEQRKRLMEQLEKQRQELIRREKVNAARKSLQNLRNSISSSVSELSVVSNDNLDSVISKIKGVIEESVAVSKTEDISAIHKMEERLNNVSRELQMAVLSIAQDEANKKMEQNEAMDKVIAKGFSVNFEKLPDKNELRKNEFNQKIQDALIELTGYKLSRELSDELTRIKAIAKDVETLDYLQNFYALIVFPFIKKCKEYNTEYEEHNEEFEEMLAKYRVLAEEIGVEILDIPEEFSMEAIANLRTGIEELEKIIMQAEEESYINKCIDEAMDEMGYHRVGSKEVVTKKTGKRKIHELYSFSEGTVVDVTYSEDGQILMQLGAASYEDRKPDANESSKLIEDMEKFCGEYSAMEEILRRKGIIRRNISLFPPKEEYAQVINVSKYDTTEDIDILDNRKKKRKVEKYRRMGE